MYQSWTRSNSGIDGASSYLISSTNGGLNWSAVHKFTGTIVWEQPDPSNLNTMYVSVADDNNSYGGIWKTTNLNAGASATWTLLPAPARTVGANHPYNIRILNDGSLVVSYGDYYGSSGFTASSGVFYFDQRRDELDRSLDRQHGLLHPGRGHRSHRSHPEHLVCRCTRRLGRQWQWRCRIVQDHQSRRDLDGGLLSEHRRRHRFVHDLASNGEMYITGEGTGLLYCANTATISQSTVTLTNYPMTTPYRVFLNPYNSNQIWVATYGYGISVGTTPTSTVSGQVFQDNNADGTFNGADSGLTRPDGLSRRRQRRLPPGRRSHHHHRVQRQLFLHRPEPPESPAPSGCKLRPPATCWTIPPPTASPPSGSTSTVNLGYFPTAYTGTSGSDTYTLAT